ncbi:glycosyltransferase family 4 protein [Capnocytophaga cynodegmi]|uniref:glycosyltransferase family 4 protein n=1 Tax=Capnocytophaga cynodegmi TaxID=28189 RepID=UPI0037D5CA6B
MKRIAIIVQRYGKKVNGGAEFHARILAEQLKKNYNICVLTTTAIDYHGWANHYPSGSTEIDGVQVIRFSTRQKSKRSMRKARRAILKKKKYFKLLRFLGLFNFFDRNFNISKITDSDIQNWLAGQGPYCPDLIAYLHKKKDMYDCFIFFTYLYYPTVVGLPIVKEKAIFIPTAHDEPPLYSKPYEKLFVQPKFIMYNTKSEKDLIESHFYDYCKNTAIAGVGIDTYSLPLGYVSEKFDFNFPYFIYIGRIDHAKGCEELILFFKKYNEKNHNVKLVMVGKDFMGVKPEENIILTGFISEEDKYFLLQNSLGLIIPSKYESLSMVTLEAMACGKLPIVNGDCEVLKHHVEKSYAGFCYTNYASFEEALEKALNTDNETKERLSQRAINYVKENYSWPAILEKFDKAIDFVSQ